MNTNFSVKGSSFSAAAKIQRKVIEQPEGAGNKPGPPTLDRAPSDKLPKLSQAEKGARSERQESHLNALRGNFALADDASTPPREDFMGALVRAANIAAENPRDNSEARQLKREYRAANAQADAALATARSQAEQLGAGTHHLPDGSVVTVNPGGEPVYHDEQGVPQKRTPASVEVRHPDGSVTTTTYDPQEPGTVRVDERDAEGRKRNTVDRYNAGSNVSVRLSNGDRVFAEEDGRLRRVHRDPPTPGRDPDPNRLGVDNRTTTVVNPDGSTERVVERDGEVTSRTHKPPLPEPKPYGGRRVRSRAAILSVS